VTWPPAPERTQTDAAGDATGRRMAYGGTDPAAAVVGHAPVETLLVEARRYLQPRTGYPDDPVTAPFRAGDVVGRLERARAAVGDARALRETVADDVREALDVGPGSAKHRCRRGGTLGGSCP